MLKCDNCLRQSVCVTELQTELAFFHRIHFLLERIADRQIMLLKLGFLMGMFLKIIEMGLNTSLKKTTDCISCQ